MNAQLLEEIIRFRRMSNLPIVENTPIKHLINESRGDAGTAIWRMVLETGELGAEAASRRQLAILKMFGDTRSEVAGKTAKSGAEETARKAAVAKVEEMIGAGKTIEEIMSFLESKMGTDNWKIINDRVEDFVSAEVKEDLIAALADPADNLTKEVVQDFNKEVKARMEQIAGDSDFVKKQALDVIKKKFIATYKKLFGFSEQEGKVVEELFEKPYKASLEIIIPTVKKGQGAWESIMTWLRGAPFLIDQFSELINLVFLSVKKDAAVLEQEISDLLIGIEQGSVKDINAGKLLADRIKNLVIKMKQFNEFADKSYTTLYNDIITKIKNSISDDKLRETILSKIEELEANVSRKDVNGKVIPGTGEEKLNVLQLFFEKLDTESAATGTQEVKALWAKVKDFFSFLKNPFGTKFKDYFGKIYAASSGWATRWWQYSLTGTLSTFKEYVEEMAKSRRSLLNRFTFGKKGKRYISGYGMDSVFDMYMRIWFRANVLIPLAINFSLSIVMFGWSCFFSTVGDKESELFGFKVGGDNSYLNLVEDSTYAKYCKAPVGSLIENEWSDIKDTFGPFALMFNGETDTLGEWFFEIFDFVIPFNTQVDNFVKWYFTDDAAEKIKKKTEEINNDDNNNNVVKPYALEHPKEYAKKMEILTLRKLQVVGLVQNRDNIPKAQELEKIMTIDTLDNKSSDPVFLYKNNTYSLKANPRRKDRPLVVYSEKDGYEFSLDEFISGNMNESRYKKTNIMITERNKEKFGEDNFKHWKDTFTFKAQDEKNPGQYKEVKIKMEDVMDRINHYRKKYDEDDSFVRAVIDTHEDVVKIMFTKDLANIHESATPRGLALVLRTIKESRGEMEIFSVARPANGNWFLVKGDYTPNQLANMDLEKKEPRTKETEVNSKSEDDLKKKEESAINVLKRNEKEGIEDLPKKVRDKVREKMGKGWTTETPPEELKEYFTTSEINSIFNDKIVIYKLEPTREFFNSLVKFSARIVIKRGFCRSLQSGKKEFELSERQKMTVNHILNKCNTKYESKLGLRNF
jgi:hypothetical protein